MRWILVCLFLINWPAGAQKTKKEWVEQPKLGWVHQLGISLRVPGKPRVSCDEDGGLKIEAKDCFALLYAFNNEVRANQDYVMLGKEAEKAFSGLKFSPIHRFTQTDGRVAFMQEGSAKGLGFLLARVSKGKYHVVLYSVMKTKPAQEANLQLLTNLKFP